MTHKKTLRTLCWTAKGYVRSIGWEAHHDGNDWRFKQPKFYLGRDQSRAELANLSLEKLWDAIRAYHRLIVERTIRFRERPHPHRVYEDCRPYSPGYAMLLPDDPLPPLDRPLWDLLTMPMARALAKGETSFPVPISEGLSDYFDWANYPSIIAILQSMYPCLKLVPADQKSYDFDCDYSAFLAACEVRTRAPSSTKMASELAPIPPDPDQMAHEVSEQTLHQALDAYVEHLRKFEKPDDSGWPRTQVNQALRLKQRHADQPLAKLDLQGVEALIDYWRTRPPAQRTGEPVSRLTARNEIKQLKDFFKWLHRHGDFAWRKPEGFEDVNCRIAKIRADVAAKANALQVQTYTAEELRILFRRATPFMRTLILLALNCGFAGAECGALRVSGIYLGQPHPRAKLLGIASCDKDSWIWGLRQKTSVWGEFKLWPETVACLRGAIARRERTAAKGDVLLVSPDGVSLTAQTRMGNKSSRIRNYWESLLDAVSQEHSDFRRLPFKQLRKTASDLVKIVSDGEVAGVFLCHGTPVKTDDLADVYTNRPFARVFAALERVRQEKLAPLFED